MARTKKNEPKTHEAKTADGRTVRCTVPESENREWPELLVEAVRETISPKAVVSIVAHLQAASTKDVAVDAQIAWFANSLRTMVDADEFDRLGDELGL